jgi:hypothetical protein
MKKITFLFILTMSFGYSQTIPIDFESDIIIGTNWNADTLTSVDVVDLTSDTPDNGNTGELVTAAGSNPWQNGQLIMTSNYIDLTDATGSKTIDVDVYTIDPLDYLLKVEDALNGGAATQAAAVHTGGGWQTLTFDFTDTAQGGPTPNDQYKKLIFFPLFNKALNDFNGSAGNSAVTTSYIDNVTGVVGDSTILPEGDPLVLIEDFDSGGITIGDTAGTIGDFNKDALESLTLVDQASDAPDNGIGGELVTAAGSNPWQNAQLILNSNYINLEGGNKTIEVDVYTIDPLDYLLKVEGALNGGAATQAAAVHTGGGWQTLTFDFTATAQSGPTPNDQYSKLIFFPLFNKALNDFNGTAGNSAVTTSYVDNIMAAIGNSLGIDDFKSSVFKAYPNPTKDNWTIKTANENITSIQVYDVLGKQVYASKPNSNEVIVSSDKLSNGLYFAKIKTINGESNLRLVKN